MSIKILIADDEKAIRDALKYVLTEEGYNADTAVDGEEALKKIEDEQYDIVISDIKMPKLDGMEILSKAAEVSPGTCFIK